MKTFAYTGYDAAGKAQGGLVEAIDLKQAREKMAAAGIFIEQINPADLSSSRGLFARRNRFPRAQRAVFYGELASLLKSGLPLVKALEIMLRSPDLSSAAALVANIRDKVREGGSLVSSITSVAGDLLPAETSFIAAGEKSGELVLTLKSLEDFIEEEIRLREKIATALIYPAIIVALALGIAVGLLGFTVPRLAHVLSDEMKISLPFFTRMMLGLGKAFVQAGPFLLAAFGAVLLVVWRMISRSADLQARLDRRLFSMPIIGKCYANLAALRFARTLTLLLRGGVGLVESVSLAGAATGSISIRLQSVTAAEEIKNGASLSDAVGRVFPLGSLLAGIIQIGENSGALEEVLQNAEERYQSKWEQQLAKVMAWLEPALILGVGVFVLLVVVSILLPILSLNRQIM